MLFRDGGLNKSRGSKVNGGPDQPLCSAHCGDEIYGSGLPKPRTPHVDWLSAMKRCDKGRRQTALWDKRLQERGERGGSGGQCWSSTRETPVWAQGGKAEGTATCRKPHGTLPFKCQGLPRP